MIQERLDEYIFHRTYLRDQAMNVWIMLRLLAQYGNKAYHYVDQAKDYTEDPDEFYRCEEIGEDDEKAQESDDDAWENRDWILDDDGNLVRYDEYGGVQEVMYANSDDEPETVEEEVQSDIQNNEEDLVFNVNDVDPDLANRLNNL